MRNFNVIQLVSVGAAALGIILILWQSQPHALEGTKLPVSLVYEDSERGEGVIRPIPLVANLDPEMVNLGRDLFNDSRLSEKGVTCASCHNLEAGGVDGRKVSVDITGGNDVMNTPSLYNVGLNTSFTWNGKHGSLESQINGVISNSRHMGGDWANILPRLAQNKGEEKSYVQRFSVLYEKGLTQDNVVSAIADYERSLITPNSAFDRFLRGEENAISDKQKSGFVLFKQYGCIACHQGVNVGGNLFARIGSFQNPFSGKKFSERLTAYNLGRYNYTGEEEDKRVFRVPSLRNVAKTSPYFHTGGVSSLEGAVKFMAKYQVGRYISDADAFLVAEFLRSLTGLYEGQEI